MAGFPQRNLLTGTQVWTGDAEQDAQASQGAFDGLALFCNQLKNRIISGLSRIASSVIYGVTDGSNATAGYIGEYLEASAAFGSVGSWTTATTKNITSLSLTAGDWLVAGQVTWSGGPITGTYTRTSLSTTSLTPAGGTLEATSPTMPTAVSPVNFAVPTRRVSLSAPGTVYLVGDIGFTAGTPAAGGAIRAWRVR